MTDFLQIYGHLRSKYPAMPRKEAARSAFISAGCWPEVLIVGIGLVALLVWLCRRFL